MNCAIVENEKLFISSPFFTEKLFIAYSKTAELQLRLPEHDCHLHEFSWLKEAQGELVPGYILVKT